MLEYEDKQARTWAMLCHLSALAQFVIPFGNLIGPLVFWLIKRDQYPLVDEQGKESLNFQISVLIYGVISAILCIVFIGILLLIALFVLQIVFVVIASVRTSNGESYRYPLTIRFLK